MRLKTVADNALVASPIFGASSRIGVTLHNPRSKVGYRTAGSQLSLVHLLAEGGDGLEQGKSR